MLLKAAWKASMMVSVALVDEPVFLSRSDGERTEPDVPVARSRLELEGLLSGDAVRRLSRLLLPGQVQRHS
jgi:hypothetical protein